MACKVASRVDLHPWDEDDHHRGDRQLQRRLHRKMTPDSRLDFRWPGGRRLAQAPKLQARGGWRADVGIDAETCLPQWQGEAFDVEYAVSALRQ